MLRREPLPVLAFGARAVTSLLLIIGVSACAPLAPHHDYPKEYPLAPDLGDCPNLNGTFRNTGAQLSHAESPSGRSILLSGLLVAGPADTSVTSVRLRGPAQDVLQIDSVTSNGRVASVIMPIAHADGFMNAKPFSSFACDRSQGANLVVTNDPEANSKTLARFYRAHDGSLIVAREQIATDFTGGAAFVARQWYRFQEAP